MKLRKRIAIKYLVRTAIAKKFLQVLGIWRREWAFDLQLYALDFHG
jgi:hypothetical protein